MKIKMKTQLILATLEENRQKHVDEFATQVQGWKKTMEKFADELAIWRDSVPEDIFDQGQHNAQRPQEPQRPVSFVKDYDELIEIVKHHVEDTIEIEEHDFNRVVKDEFGWKGRFLANSALYSSH